MIPKSGVRFSDQDHAPLTKRGIQFASPENKGGGAPNGAPPVPASERDAGAVICDRSPFGAPPRLCAGIIHPNSAWAALPGIAGCKRGSPLRRQCSRHPAVRSRAGRVDAQTACKLRATNSARRNRTRSINRCHRPMSLTMRAIIPYLTSFWHWTILPPLIEGGRHGQSQIHQTAYKCRF